MENYLEVRKKIPTFALEIENGTLADRLGNGLQNRVEQFDSARYLQEIFVLRWAILPIGDFSYVLCMQS